MHHIGNVCISPEGLQRLHGMFQTWITPLQEHTLSRVSKRLIDFSYFRGNPTLLPAIFSCWIQKTLHDALSWGSL